MPGTSIYVSGLPMGLDDVSFRQLFSVYGAVISTKYFASQRYGFVSYASAQEAERVVQSMDGFEHSGCKVSVKLAQGGDSSGAGVLSGAYPAGAKGGEQMPGPSDNLYVKGLPPFYSEDLICQVFGAYGPVSSTRVLQSNATNSNPSGETIALVRMRSAEHASWIVANLNGNIPQGLDRPILARYADAKGGKGMQGMLGLPKGASVDGRYSPYPGVGGKGGVKGFDGGGKVAAAAVAAAPCPDIQAVLAKTLAVLGQQASGGSAEPPPVDEGNIADRDQSSLYIKGLPPEAGDLFLYKVFAPFGAIESVHAMLNADGSGTCTGIGFVRFVKTAEATMAVGSVNQVPRADGHVLHVSFKRPKRAKAPEEVAPPASARAALADATFGAPDIDGIRPGMEGILWPSVEAS